MLALLTQVCATSLQCSPQSTTIRLCSHSKQDSKAAIILTSDPAVIPGRIISKEGTLKFLLISSVFLTVVSLSACTSSPSSSPAITSTADNCGASQYQQLVGGPSSATLKLKIPPQSRHYGSEERVATDMPSRLNFIHSGTAFEAVTNPKSTIVRVFCG